MEIRKSIIIDASARTIFEALTSSEQLTLWFQDEATFEKRLGGKVVLTTRKDKHPEWKLDRDYINEGVVIEYTPNKKVSYTWSIRDFPEFPNTIVTWELEEIESKKTKVTITHTGFTGKEIGMTSIQNHEEGWAEGLKQLAKYCEQYESK